MPTVGSEEKPLQEVLPDAPTDAVSGAATASDVDVSGGLAALPPATPPRGVSSGDLAAGVPITPAPSMEAQSDRWVLTLLRLLCRSDAIIVDVCLEVNSSEEPCSYRKALSTRI